MYMESALGEDKRRCYDEFEIKSVNQYVVGFIKYRDIFQNPRTSRFCFKLIFDENGNGLTEPFDPPQSRCACYLRT